MSQYCPFTFHYTYFCVLTNVKYMNDKKLGYFANYHSLIGEIDELSEVLSAQHTSQMQCKEGCSSCCESISVFAVEFDSIQRQIKDEKILLPKRGLFQSITKGCRFLVKNRCSIYSIRPLICRTQGLPILYRSATSNHYELSVCKLNFKKVSPSFFNDGNALMLSPFNTRFLLLNQAYLKEVKPEEKNINLRRKLFELEE